MEAVHDDRFLVFVRVDSSHPYLPESKEHYLTSCATYGEARRIQQENRSCARDCVIRFIGPTGGGD